MSNIYFDNAASTPLDTKVISEMQEVMKEHYGNPSSIHNHGRKSRSIIEKARKNIAEGLNCSIGEIFFTSCGTESNNTIIKSAIRDLDIKHIVSSKIEHPCILNTLESCLKSEDIKITYVKLDELGRADTDHLKKILTISDEKTLVSLMHANNEVGTLNDLELISELCIDNEAYFHSDTVQTIGHLPIDLQKLNIHFLSGSAHKFNGPKGVGFFYMNSDAIFNPFLHGGAQERNMRAGTENIYGIQGMSTAFSLALNNMEEYCEHVSGLRQHMKDKLKDLIPNIEFNGCQDKFLYTILSVKFPPHEKNDMLLMYLDVKGISASGGSACSSGSQKPSHVISELSNDTEATTIRFSFNHQNTIKEIDYTIDQLKEIFS